MEDDSRLFVLLAVITSLFVVYGLFVLISVAVIRARRSQLSQMVEGKHRRLRKIRWVLSRSSRFLLAIEIAKFLIAVTIGVGVLQLLLSPVIVGAIQMLSFGGEAMVWGVCAAAALLAVAGVVAVIVQIAKALAYANPERVLYHTADLLLIFEKLMYPLVALPGKLATKLLRAWDLALPAEREAALSTEELSEIVERSTEAGELEEDELEMIQGVFSFGDTLVREIMTPRVDIIAVPRDASLQEIKDLISNEGLSRLLVVGSELDDVDGIVIAKDLMPLVGQDEEHFDLSTIVRKPLFVTGEQPIDDVLRELRKEAMHFAVVFDEHGGVDGIVTMEDIIEELVGDIFDETDSPEDEEEYTETRSGDLLVDGGVVIDDLNNDYDYAFPEGEYDTLAGLVIHLLGHIPDEGESVEIEGVTVKVEELSQNRITRLRIVDNTSAAA